MPSRQAYDPTTHLSVEDVTVDSPSQPSVVEVKIKASKMDPFSQGVSVFLGATGNTLCPVAAITAIWWPEGEMLVHSFAMRMGVRFLATAL